MTTPHEHADLEATLARELADLARISIYEPARAAVEDVIHDLARELSAPAPEAPDADR